MSLPQRILVLGSSSIGERGSGNLGQALKNQLDADLYFIGKSGAGFKDFAGNSLQRSTLLSQIRSFGPQLVLVVMGGNPTGTASELESAMRWLKDAAAASGVSVLWAGPPVYAATFNQRISDMYDAIGPMVFGSDYVSSQPWTNTTVGRTKDRVHFTDYGATLWGQKIVDWVRGRTSPSLVAVGGGMLAVLAAVGAAFWFFRRRSHA